MQISNISAFIEDAIAGGWLTDHFFHGINRDEVAFGNVRNDSENNPSHYRSVHEILLDPLFWQAVGKTRGWYVNMKCTEEHSNNYEGTCTLNAWHHFIDHIADGLDIDTALGKLT